MSISVLIHTYAHLSISVLIHTYAHLMTSRELPSGFDFWLGGHLRGRGASSHKIWCRYMYPVQSY